MSSALNQAIAPETRPVPESQTPGSSGELTEQYDVVQRVRRDVAYRLKEAFDEIAAINQLYQQRRTEFESEKRLLNSEIEKLQAQVMEHAARNEKKAAVNGGVQSLLETKERLIREEFERKFQELAVQVKRQRKQYAGQVDEMKKQLSNCICNGSGWGR